MGNRIYYGDAFKSLCELKDESVDLVYVRLPSRISINKKYQFLLTSFLLL